MVLQYFKNVNVGVQFNGKEYYWKHVNVCRMLNVSVGKRKNVKC